MLCAPKHEPCIDIAFVNVQLNVLAKTSGTFVYLNIIRPLSIVFYERDCSYFLVLKVQTNGVNRFVSFKTFNYVFYSLNTLIYAHIPPVFHSSRFNFNTIAISPGQYSSVSVIYIPPTAIQNNACAVTAKKGKKTLFNSVYGGLCLFLGFTWESNNNILFYGPLSI